MTSTATGQLQRKMPQTHNIVFLALMASLIGYHVFYLSKITSPAWDSSVYLENAHDWMTAQPLSETFRPPLISWIITGIWTITGENWETIKFLPVMFMTASMTILYFFIKERKGGLFALGVIGLTAFNPTLFTNVEDILTEQLSLMFLSLTLYFSGDRKWGWLIGVAIGLTFASRYPIVLPAFAILVCTSIVQKDWRYFVKGLATSIAVVAIVIIAVHLKTGTFSMGLEKDEHFTYLLNPYYLVNAYAIWGPAILLVPIALLFRDTYRKKFNYNFMVMIGVSLLFWSANSNPTEFQYRFTIAFTPAIYYLSMLSIENVLFKTKKLTAERREATTKKDVI